jgi:hypothetical protein
MFACSTVFASEKCDLMVMFPSHCCGINLTQRNHIFDYLSSKNSQLTFEETIRGREGEKEFCIHLLNPKEKSLHAKKIKKILEKNVSDKPSGQLTE